MAPPIKAPGQPCCVVCQCLEVLDACNDLAEQDGCACHDEAGAENPFGGLLRPLGAGYKDGERGAVESEKRAERGGSESGQHSPARIDRLSGGVLGEE